MCVHTHHHPLKHRWDTKKVSCWLYHDPRSCAGLNFLPQFNLGDRKRTKPSQLCSAASIVIVHSARSQDWKDAVNDFGPHILRKCLRIFWLPAENCPQSSSWVTLNLFGTHQIKAIQNTIFGGCGSGGRESRSFLCFVVCCVLFEFCKEFLLSDSFVDLLDKRHLFYFSH